MAIKPEELADKILKKATDALEPIEREMRIMKWPPEFRNIMWDAVARLAMSRANEQTTPEKS